MRSLGQIMDVNDIWPCPRQSQEAAHQRRKMNKPTAGAEMKAKHMLAGHRPTARLAPRTMDRMAPRSQSVLERFNHRLHSTRVRTVDRSIEKDAQIGNLRLESGVGGRGRMPSCHAATLATFDRVFRMPEETRYLIFPPDFRTARIFEGGQRQFGIAPGIAGD